MDCAAFVIIDAMPAGIRGVKLLLIQKEGETKWKCVGGKYDPTVDQSPIWTVEREIGEEIGEKAQKSIRIDASNKFFETLVRKEPPHRFIVFSERVPEFRLEWLKLEKKIRFAALFDERQLVPMLNMNQIVPLHDAAIQQYLADRSILLS